MVAILLVQLNHLKKPKQQTKTTAHNLPFIGIETEFDRLYNDIFEAKHLVLV